MKRVVRRPARPPRDYPVQTAEQPVDNAGENYAGSTAATAGVAAARDAQIKQGEAIAEQKEIASTLTLVLTVLGALVALTAIT